MHWLLEAPLANPLFTIIIPTHDHGDLIQYCLRSILRQSCQDFEVIVIGDGISTEGQECVASFCAQDNRITLKSFPKGPRLGEAYRHDIIKHHARGSLICYASDDDLLLPRHLEYMGAALKEHDFVHPLPAFVNTRDEVNIAAGSLIIDAVRRRLLRQKHYNFIALHGTTHTREFYLRLPFGWRTTPVGTPTDLYMWQQFLAEPTCKALTHRALSMLHFPSPDRRSWTHAQRHAELRAWEALLSEPAGELEIYTRALSNLALTRTWETERTPLTAVQDIGSVADGIKFLGSAGRLLGSSLWRRKYT